MSNQSSDVLVIGSKKRNRRKVSFTFTDSQWEKQEDSDIEDRDSDEDFVIEKKKDRIRKPTTIKAKTSLKKSMSKKFLRIRDTQPKYCHMVNKAGSSSKIGELKRPPAKDENTNTESAANSDIDCQLKVEKEENHNMLDEIKMNVALEKDMMLTPSLILKEEVQEEFKSWADSVQQSPRVTEDTGAVRDKLPAGDLKHSRLSADSGHLMMESRNTANRHLESHKTPMNKVALLITDIRQSDTPHHISTSHGPVKVYVKDAENIVENFNLDVMEKQVEATPEQINSRNCDKEMFITPSSHSSMNIKNVSKTGQLPSPANCYLTCSPRQANTHFLPATTRPPTFPSPSVRAAQHYRPTIPRRVSGNSRSMTGGHLRLGGRESKPTDTRLPNVRSINQVRQPTPTYLLPSAVGGTCEQACPTTSCSLFNKLSSLGVSVARDKVPTTIQDCVLPPGLNISRTTTKREEAPSLTIPSLGRTLLQLCEGEGSKRFVQFRLTEEQMRGLDILGVRQGV